eukprot:CAMPEP_0177163650 /NCGR_PEP_ID=MMETSP0367-20130122/6524_1 /TAXON_ID=447022 ORGANISM="Scrippsiella hangoei-like, Strain SHHI-4" /NCGR_SAMPLE_ID=MMETSP0367 /ASSEMBLY_ACC=CAM_ASM_000362 /LENGTH=348 /DNA_ID=CAMNT_0018609487 /DNA_START=1 /DNA_END=1043 /DNA_ORIENTATION=+
MVAPGAFQLRTLDVLCEEERVRRLSERMLRDPAETAEHAREGRARSLARALVKEGLANVPEGEGEAEAAVRGSPAGSPMHISTSPRSLAVQQLESRMQVRRKAAAREQSPTVFDITAGDPREITIPTSPSIAVDPAKSPNPPDMRGRLADALDAITVKSVVELRNLVSIPPSAEAVVVVTLCLASSVDSGAATSALPGAPRNWAEAKTALLRPGSVLNSLRRFPYAAERGQVSQDVLCIVEETLAEVLFQGAGLEKVHPTLAQFYHWLRYAVEYSSACGQTLLLDNVPSPVRRAQGKTPGFVEKTASMNLAVDAGVRGKAGAGFSVSWATLADDAPQGLGFAAPAALA